MCDFNTLSFSFSFSVTYFLIYTCTLLASLLCQNKLLILCMGCHPHTRVNPAQHMVRKETQELMWLQTIYKILFRHNKEASNATVDEEASNRENGRMRE